MRKVIAGGENSTIYVYALGQEQRSLSVKLCTLFTLYTVFRLRVNIHYLPSAKKRRFIAARAFAGLCTLSINKTLTIWSEN